MILPSFSEGVPMAVLEAWAHAKPALITPQCNLPEGIEAGAAIGFSPDSNAIVAALKLILGAERETFESMGACGRKLIARRFAWPKIVADLKAVYGWLHGGPKPECIIAH